MDKFTELLENLELAERQLKAHTEIPQSERKSMYNYWWSRYANNVRSAKKSIVAHRLQATKVTGILKAAGLPIRKVYNTAIKGWHDYSYGFYSHTEEDGVWIYTQSQGHRSLGTFQDVSKLQIWVAIGALEAAGYTVIRQGTSSLKLTELCTLADLS